MPELVPVAASPDDTAVPAPISVAGDTATIDIALAAAAALLAISKAPEDLAESATLPVVVGVLAQAVKELPSLFRRLSGRSGDTYAAEQPVSHRDGQHMAAVAASFWFQMEAAADAADRLHLALNTAHAALYEEGEER